MQESSLGVALRVRATLCTFFARLGEERAQNSVEYLMAVGAVVAVLAAGLILGFQAILPDILRSACNSVDPLSAGDCIP